MALNASWPMVERLLAVGLLLEIQHRAVSASARTGLGPVLPPRNATG